MDGKERCWFQTAEATGTCSGKRFRLSEENIVDLYIRGKNRGNFSLFLLWKKKQRKRELDCGDQEFRTLVDHQTFIVPSKSIQRSITMVTGLFPETCSAYNSHQQPLHEKGRKNHATTFLCHPEFFLRENNKPLPP